MLLAWSMYTSAEVYVTSCHVVFGANCGGCVTPKRKRSTKPFGMRLFCTIATKTCLDCETTSSLWASAKDQQR